MSLHAGGRVTAVLCSKLVSLIQPVSNGSRKLSASKLEVCGNSYGRDL